MVDMKSQQNRAAGEILEAQKAVERATRSGNLNEINAANKRLAGAHAYYDECAGGNVHDKRGE